jgi:hypothetical protein
MRRALMILAGALVLGACHKPAETGGGAQAQIPRRKAGLWQESVLRDGKPMAMGQSRTCADPNKDNRASVFGRKLGHGICPNHTIVRNADGSYTFTSTCDMGPAGKVSARGQASGDFSSVYRVRAESDVTGAAFAALNGHHVTEMEVAYVGRCPNGMKPGDVLLANGMKISGDRAIAAAAALGGGQ